MNRELSRFELAIVKRTAQNTKSLRTKRDKLVATMQKAQEELSVIETVIEGFEAPIRTMTGGFTSEEVLSGIMAVAEATNATPEGEVSNDIVEEVEVPASDAVVLASSDTTDDIPFKD